MERFYKIVAPSRTADVNERLLHAFHSISCICVAVPGEFTGVRCGTPDDRTFRFGNLQTDSCSHTVPAAAAVVTALNSARYSCSFCNYSTIYKDTLIKHERTHTGDKPFRCAICGYAASQRNNVRIHAARKHGTLDCVYDERKVLKTF